MIAIAEPADGAAIARITRAVRVFNPEEVACVQELWDEYTQRGEASGYHFLVAREDNHVFGYACFGPRALAENVYDFYWLATDPDAQHRGVGRALMQQVEAHVAAQNGRLLLIETSATPPYQAARRLYESCGYRYQAVIHDFYAPGDDLLVYGKTFMPTWTK
jgi:GNAT superfamily N-acetyltransferase